MCAKNNQGFPGRDEIRNDSRHDKTMDDQAYCHGEYEVFSFGEYFYRLKTFLVMFFSAGFLCWWNSGATYLTLSSGRMFLMCLITLFFCFVFWYIICLIKIHFKPSPRLAALNPVGALNLAVVLCLGFFYVFAIRSFFSKEFGAMPFDAIPIGITRGPSPSSLFKESFHWWARWVIVSYTASLSLEKGGLTQAMSNFGRSIARYSGPLVKDQKSPLV